MLLVISAIGFYAKAETTITWTDCSTYMEVQQAYRAGKTHIRLTADIDMGTDSNKKEFKDFLEDYDTDNLILTDCVFDGQDHAIENMCYDKNSYGTDYVGLFRKAKNSTFRNVKFVNAKLKSYDYAGCMCAYAENCTFENITVFDNGTEINAFGSFCGGIVGYLNGGSISNSVVNATELTALFYFGGIVGYTKNVNITNCRSKCTTIEIYENDDDDHNYTGGIVGKAVSGSITDCVNLSNVNGYLPYAGGIAGFADGVAIAGCINYGSVYEDGNDEKGYCGGIVGYISSSSSSITNCINNGTIECKGYYVGGIAGCSLCNITGCVNNGNVTNQGKTYDYYVGGITGYFKGDIICCTNTGTIAGDNFVGGIAGCCIRSSSSDITKYTIADCLHTGTVYGEGLESGGLVGYADKYTDITRCVSVGLYYYNDKLNSNWCYGYDKDEGDTEPNVSYCLFTETDGWENQGNHVYRITPAQYSTGYATYFMEQAGSDSYWRQNIDNGKTVDSEPVLCYTTEQQEAHDIVYAYYTKCFEDQQYSNTKHNDYHDFVDGVCTICGYPKDGSTKLINNIKDFIDFTNLTNRGISLNGRLYTDITLDKDCDWTATIGNSEDTPYTGMFNGYGHTITLNYSEAGDFNPQCVFENVKDATITDLLVKGDVMAKNPYASGLDTTPWATVSASTVACHSSISHRHSTAMHHTVVWWLSTRQRDSI